MQAPAYKRCTKCGEERPTGDFYRDRRKADGLESWCKRCKLEANRKWQIENPEKQAAIAKRWNSRNPKARTAATRRWRERNPERVAAHHRRKIERNPEKHRAHWTVWNAVKQGRLVKPDCCEGCGGPTEKHRLQGHHADYSKPLAVEWLCHACHVERHA